MPAVTGADKVAVYDAALRRSEPDNPGDEVVWADTVPAPCEVTNGGPVPGFVELTTFDLVDLLLKNQRRLDQLSRSPAMQRELIPRLLMIGLMGYTVFGIALVFVFQSAQVWPALTPAATWLEQGSKLIEFVPEPQTAYVSHWLDGSALAVIVAFTFGMIGSIGVCLPSFYFYGLLAGVQTTMLQVTTNALKGLASSAVALVGTLPIYFAVVLGWLVFQAAGWLVAAICFAGLILPFVAGLYGTRSLYLGFVGLADTLEPERRCRRECFLRRLLFAWSACFTAVTPVMIFTVWGSLSR